MSDALDALRAAGLKVSAMGERLLVQPRAALTDALRALIRSRKEEILQALAPPKASSAPREPSITIAPGRHVIDGKPIDVPRSGDQDLVQFPLPAGRHVIDGRIAIVADPRHGISPW